MRRMGVRPKIVGVNSVQFSVGMDIFRVDRFCRHDDL